MQPYHLYLNQEKLGFADDSALPLSDFIRDREGAKSTKVACKEGDCGACTVLLGAKENSDVCFRAIASCIAHCFQAQSCQVITADGLLASIENPIFHHFAREGATQCGFCTPGFAVAIVGGLISLPTIDYPSLLLALDGNVCRCTGYQSIKKAVAKIAQDYGPELSQVQGNRRLQLLAKHRFIKEDVVATAMALPARGQGGEVAHSGEMGRVIGNGTDLYVQIPERIHDKGLAVSGFAKNSKIYEEAGSLYLGAQTSIEDARLSALVAKHLPTLSKDLCLFASTPIRNLATIAGNVVNASPIGDMSNILLALQAEVHLKGPAGDRKLALAEFYLDYKKVDLRVGERIDAFSIDIQDPLSFSFEKVSKRTHLDIASVTTSIAIAKDGTFIKKASLSAGGVFRYPLFLGKTSSFLTKKSASVSLVKEAWQIAQSEIAPISDIRGQASYKTFLFRQLFFAHFLKLFPEILSLTDFSSPN